jgi:hypothetical protein
VVVAAAAARSPISYVKVNGSQNTSVGSSRREYFPIGVWFESVTSQADVNMDKDVGLNLYVVLTANSDLSLVRSNGMQAILQQSVWKNNPAALSDPAVAGWELYDQIDMVQGPGQGYTTMQNIINSLPADGRLRYNNYGKGVMFWQTDEQAAKFVNAYQDVVSANAYWFTDPHISSGSEGGVLLNNGNPLLAAQTRRAANYGYTVDRMRMLDGMTGGSAPLDRKPIWNVVEVGWPFSETAAQGGRTILPAEIKAAVWHSIIAGARGIIYFNHSIGGLNPTQHVLRDPVYATVRAVVKSTDALILQLAPVLNAPFADGFVTSTASIRAMAKYSDGKYYVFAGSKENVASSATFTLEGISNGIATVIDESRTIPISDGIFTDAFVDGNAVHIYRIDPSRVPLAH